MIAIILDDTDADLVLLALEAWNDEGATDDERRRAFGIMGAIRQERAERDRKGTDQ
jgi:hypothetical protein